MNAQTDPSEGEAAGSGAPLFRPFAWAALVSTLTLGTVYGAANLLVIHAGRGASWVNPAAHATAQLFGFLFLLVAGLILESLPGTARAQAARAAGWVWPLMVLGAVARASAQFLTTGPWAVWLGVAGAVGMTAAAALFAALLWRARASVDHWFLWGAAGWLLSSAVLLAGAVDAALWGEAFAAAAWNEAAYRAALFGGGLGWTVGLLARFGPELAGLRAAAIRRLTFARPGAALAVLLLVAGAVLEDRFGVEWARIPSLTGWGLLALTSAGIALGSGLLLPGGAAGGEEVTTRLLRWAVGALVLFAGLTGALVVLALRGASNHLVVDSARHAFAIGFAMLLVFALACRILPARAGVALAWPESRGLAGGLIAVTVLLRSLEIGAGLGATRLLWLSGISGVLASFGVGVFAICLGPTLRRAQWQRAPTDAAR